MTDPTPRPPSITRRKPTTPTEPDSSSISGADPNLADTHIGATPWGWANHFGNTETAAYLEPLTHGGDPLPESHRPLVADRSHARHARTDRPPPPADPPHDDRAHPRAARSGRDLAQRWARSARPVRSRSTSTQTTSLGTRSARASRSPNRSASQAPTSDGRSTSLHKRRSPSSRR